MEITEQVLLDEIWKNQGINSHSLLARLVAQGYKYSEHGSNSYLKLLANIRSRKDTRYVKASDKYYVIKHVDIKLPIESIRTRRNCYDCEFMRKVQDNAELREDKDTACMDSYCALDKSIVLKLNLYCLDKVKCPLNEAINKAIENGEL